MINRLIKGRDFRGLLDYLASRPGAEIVGGNMEGANPRELAREFRFVRILLGERLLGTSVLTAVFNCPMCVCLIESGPAGHVEAGGFR